MRVPGVVLGTLLVLSQTAQAQTGPSGTDTARVTDPSVNRVLARRMTLADLGFRDGLSFRQLSGNTTLYVPVADSTAVTAVGLELDIEHGATEEADRYLQVSVGGRVVATQALLGGTRQLTLPVTLTPDDIVGGFLTIGLNYSGALSDRICVDERASGDFLAIAPTSFVSLALDPQAVTSPEGFSALRPVDTRVLLTGENSLARLAAVTRAAALFDAESGHLRFGPRPAEQTEELWSEGTVALTVTASGVASEMAVAVEDDRPVLSVRGTDPQVGLWQLASPWAGLAGGNPAVTRSIGTPPMAGDKLALASMNADLTARPVVASEDFLIPFQSSDIPVGQDVSALDLRVVAALDPEGRGATASVYLNGSFLGNRPLDSGMPERLSFPVPGGLVGRDNLVRVSVQRQPMGGECRFKPQGYPAQVLPGSALDLADAQDAPSHFFQLRQAFGAGVQVVLDPALAPDFDQVVPWLAGVAGSMIPDRATIVPRADVDAIEPDQSFLVVSPDNPGDQDPTIVFDNGRVLIQDSQGNQMFDGDGLSRLGVVQMVTRGGSRGLWLRPGDGPAPRMTDARPLILDRGDLALIGEDGVIVATSTEEAPLVDVSYPDRTSLSQVLAKYRPWIAGGLWVLLTLVVLVVFQRVYRARRAPPEG